MAIRLASAIGQQREPIGILGDLDNAVNKTGDAIQAEQQRKAAELAKKKDQEQKYKDIVSASLKTRNLEGVRSEDWQEDQDFQKKGIADILKASADPNITRAQLDKMQMDFDEGLQKREHLYKRDWKAITSVAKKQDTHNTTLFDNFITGKTDPTQVANMPNDDFMAASETNRAGKMPQDNMPQYGTGEDFVSKDRMIILPNGETTNIETFSKSPTGEVEKMNEMKRTETQTNYQAVPYFNKSIDERLKTDIEAKESELTVLKRPNIVKAAQGYLGSDFKFGSLTKRTDKISPTTGEYIFEFDEKGADELAKKFASSMVGKGNFGSKDHSQYQRGLEYEALAAGNEAGFSGESLAAFVQETVPQMAYDDFMKDARSAEAERMKNDKDVTKAPSKELNITFNGNGNGGGSNKYWNVEKGETRDLNKAKDGVATKDKLGKYTEYTFESIATPENAKVLNLGGYNNVVMKGVEVNDKTGEVEYIRVVVPKMAASAENGFVEQKGGTRMVKVTKDDVNSLRTNLGDELYDKTIGAHKTPKAIKSNANEISKWSKGNEYQVGEKVYFYDKASNKWKTK